ncbi:MAG: glycoside hydrolase family 88 protein [Sediminibacterium sp.]|jgi:unsaturated rhamnogalacturonyl hydrolase
MKFLKLQLPCVVLLCFELSTVFAQQPTVKMNDSNTPLHALQPNYPVSYSAPSKESIELVLNKVYSYLDTHTFASLQNKKTGAISNTLSTIDTNLILQPGDFRLTSYEWGVTYAGMLKAGQATGDNKFTDYTTKRLSFLANIAPYFKEQLKQYPQVNNPLKQLLDPHALDDAGAVCASMIKALPLLNSKEATPVINNYIDFISNKEYRLTDGTMARNRPLKNTIWLDDMFMSIPALAQMGKLTGNKKYTDDAVKQILQFSSRMFNPSVNLYMHGWVESMEAHPEFRWARANGWALLATVELLDVLPENHPSRKQIIALLQAHIKGITSFQSGSGFWHQLLDRQDSYLETSATAIYAYCMAHAINKGWINPKTYGPAVLLAWNAVATKVTTAGQIEGTCVGTGMAFDPAFYYYRPTNIYAAHGYGPVLLAGAEVLDLIKKYHYYLNDSALQLKEK